MMFDVYAKEVMNFIYAVLSSKPEVIGISVHWSSLIAARLLANKFKQYSPETKVIFGGPQVAYYTSVWKELLRNKEVDAVVFGEGEESLKEYLAALGSSSDMLIKGVAYTGFSKDIIDGGLREPVTSLDSLPFADFSDFDLNLYAGYNVIPIYFSRGCINHCCYCTENKFFPRFRNRTGKRLFEEVVHQLTLYPKTEYFRMHDSISNANINELETFCDLLVENKIKTQFNLENAVIRKEMTGRLYKKLRESGCTLIGYGLESPSKKLLRQVGKTACLDADFEKIIADGVRKGITIGINMMFGLPGESEADFQEQLLFIEKLKKFRKRIVINPALNFCYFPEGCEASFNPAKFNVDLKNGELYWESSDGENTFLDRLAKFEKFCALANKFGYRNFFGVTQNINRNALLGQYYFVKKEYPLALDYLLKSFEREIKTLELAMDIAKLCKEASCNTIRVPDDVNSFIVSENKDPNCILNNINTRQELDGFILRQSILSSMIRLEKIIKKRDSYKPVVFGLTLPKLKAYAKYEFFNLVERILYKADKRYVVLTQLLKEIDNKIEIVIERCGGVNSNTDRRH